MNNQQQPRQYQQQHQAQTVESSKRPIYKRTWFWVVTALIAFLVIIPLLSGEDEPVSSATNIESLKYDSEGHYYDVILSSECDWDNLTARNRRTIVEQAFDEVEAHALDNDVADEYAIFGYTSSGKLAFNRIKTFVDGSPAEDIS